MRSTQPITRRAALLTPLAVAGCVSAGSGPGPAIEPPAMAQQGFTMADGARLPYRTWLPDGPTRAVMLALHGFNDSRDAFEYPGPSYAAAGIAVFAPDQRGFGAAPGRGLWPGGDALVADAATMVRLLHAQYPGQRLFVLGESMGGAVAMRLAAEVELPVSGYVLSAPAVWGRADMSLVMRGALWLAATLAPGLEVGRGPVQVRPSDNNAALQRLSRDPLTLHDTRFDTLRGLVDLMDQALAAAPGFAASGLFQYGAHDDLVPPHATAAMWRRLPPAAIRAFYPEGYHLLPRDINRAAPTGDVIAWVLTGTAPEAAQAAARTWLAAEG